jgi:hypothetical protein
MDKDDLRTFMCNSVAVAMGNDFFWVGLKRLRDEWGIDKDDLRTFVCGSVAAAMGNDFFWVGLKRLHDEWGMDKDNLRTFMCNSVAAAMGKDCFWTGLKHLRVARLTKETVEIMCGGVATRMNIEYAQDIIALCELLKQCGCNHKVKALLKDSPFLKYVGSVVEFFKLSPEVERHKQIKGLLKGSYSAKTRRAG